METKKTDGLQSKQDSQSKPQPPKEKFELCVYNEKGLLFLKWSFISGVLIGLLFALPYVLNHIAFTARACRNVRESFKELKK